MGFESITLMSEQQVPRTERMDKTTGQPNHHYMRTVLAEYLSSRAQSFKIHVCEFAVYEYYKCHITESPAQSTPRSNPGSDTK